MNKLVVYISLISCFVFVGCSSTQTSEDSSPKTEAASEEKSSEKTGLTEEQVSKMLSEFPGVSREHAQDLWTAKEKADIAQNDITAYWELRQRFGENSPSMLEAAIKSTTEAKNLLEPLCREYPHNAPLNSLADMIIQGLKSLEEQKR